MTSVKLDHPARGCKCYEHEQQRIYQRRYYRASKLRRNGQGDPDAGRRPESSLFSTKRRLSAASVRMLDQVSLMISRGCTSNKRIMDELGISYEDLQYIKRAMAE